MMAHQIESLKATEQEQYSVATIAVVVVVVEVALTKNTTKNHHQQHHQEILDDRAHILGYMALERETKNHPRRSTFHPCSCSSKLAPNLTERVCEVCVYK